LRGWDKGVNFKQKYAGVYIFPKSQNFSRIDFWMKETLPFFQKRSSRDSWKSFCNSQMETLSQNLRFWKLFQDQKRLMENNHPWKYDHNYINARILGLEKSNYRPVFFNEKILASFFFVEMFRGRGTLFWLRIIWKMPCFFVVV